MGKGDKKTKRGKIIMGLYGVRRPKRRKQTVVAEIKPVVAKTKVVKAKKQKSLRKRRNLQLKRQLLRRRKKP